MFTLLARLIANLVLVGGSHVMSVHCEDFFAPSGTPKSGPGARISCTQPISAEWASISNVRPTLPQTLMRNGLELNSPAPAVAQSLLNIVAPSDAQATLFNVVETVHASNDPVVRQLFFLYVRALFKDERYEDVMEVTHGLQMAPASMTDPVQLDAGDLYLAPSDNLLGIMVILYREMAAAMIPLDSPKGDRIAAALARMNVYNLFNSSVGVREYTLSQAGRYLKTIDKGAATFDGRFILRRFCGNENLLDLSPFMLELRRTVESCHAVEPWDRLKMGLELGFVGAGTVGDVPHIFVGRDIRFAIVAKASQVRIYGPTGAHRLYLDWCRSNLAVNDVFVSVSVLSTPTLGAVIQFPYGQVQFSRDHIHIRPEDLDRVLEGIRLEGPLSEAIDEIVSQNRSLVLTDNPITAVSAEATRSAEALAAGLAAAYPELRVYVDRDDGKLEERILVTESFAPRRDAKGNIENVVVVTDGREEPTDDWQLIAGLADTLKAAKLRTEKFRGEVQVNPQSGQAVIVITAHSDSRVGALIDDLGASGVLSGNIVVFLSCNTPLRPEHIKLLSGKYGATSVFVPAGSPNPAEAYRFVNSLAMQLAALKRLRDALQDSLKAAKIRGLWRVAAAESSDCGMINSEENYERQIA